MSAFRRGQWVRTTRPLLVKAKVAGQDMVVTVPAPSLGIYHALDIERSEQLIDEKGQPAVDKDGNPLLRVVPGREYHLETGLPKIFGKDGEAAPTNLVGLHLVDSETGFNTILEVAVPPSALEPVTNLEDIPEPRRKTFAEGWKPTV